MYAIFLSIYFFFIAFTQILFLYKFGKNTHHIWCFCHIRTVFHSLSAIFTKYTEITQNQVLQELFICFDLCVSFTQFPIYFYRIYDE